MTVSRTWMTPFVAKMSTAITVAEAYSEETTTDRRSLTTVISSPPTVVRVVAPSGMSAD